uniref:Uncharacterized protein n=1 Tax=Opuntia streptacantha TaxID=393608 RepID=A0A7C9CW68_OPUST
MSIANIFITPSSAIFFTSSFTSSFLPSSLRPKRRKHSERPHPSKARSTVAIISRPSELLSIISGHSRLLSSLGHEASCPIGNPSLALSTSREASSPVFDLLIALSTSLVPQAEEQSASFTDLRLTAVDTARPFMVINSCIASRKRVADVPDREVISPENS